MDSLKTNCLHFFSLPKMLAKFIFIFNLIHFQKDIGAFSIGNINHEHLFNNLLKHLAIFLLIGLWREVWTPCLTPLTSKHKFILQCARSTRTSAPSPTTPSLAKLTLVNPRDVFHIASLIWYARAHCGNVYLRHCSFNQYIFSSEIRGALVDVMKIIIELPVSYCAQTRYTTIRARSFLSRAIIII